MSDSAALAPNKVAGKTSAAVRTLQVGVWLGLAVQLVFLAVVWLAHQSALHALNDPLAPEVRATQLARAAIRMISYSVAAAGIELFLLAVLLLVFVSQWKKSNPIARYGFVVAILSLMLPAVAPGPNSNPGLRVVVFLVLFAAFLAAAVWLLRSRRAAGELNFLLAPMFFNSCMIVLAGFLARNFSTLAQISPVDKTRYLLVSTLVALEVFVIPLLAVAIVAVVLCGYTLVQKRPRVPADAGIAMPFGAANLLASLAVVGLFIFLLLDFFVSTAKAAVVPNAEWSKPSAEQLKRAQISTDLNIWGDACPAGVTAAYKCMSRYITLGTDRGAVAVDLARSSNYKMVLKKTALADRRVVDCLQKELIDKNDWLPRASRDQLAQAQIEELRLIFFFP
jgi:hypothetical protein